MFSSSSHFALDPGPPPPQRRTIKPLSFRSALRFTSLVALFAALYFGSKQAWSTGKAVRAIIQHESAPHVRYHHQGEAADVVSSFFGPEGGVERFQLVASLYFAIQAERPLGEDGAVVEWENGVERWKPWRRVFSAPVLEDLNVETSPRLLTAKVDVRLPGVIV